MSAFIESFRSHFQRGSNLFDSCNSYIFGLLQSPKANMERMEESVQGADYECLQYLISDGKWNEWDVMDQLARDSNQLLGEKQEQCLLFDESAFAKKGKCSAGVGRQYNGRLGKVENSQVGVFACLCNTKYVIPIYARLFLPEFWTKDKNELKRVNISKEFQRFKTKPEIVLELVVRARSQGLKYGWIAADGLYGNCPKLLWNLIENEDLFVLGIQCRQKVYQAPPNPKCMEEKGKKKSVVKWETDQASIRTDELIGSCEDSSWQLIKVREATSGLLCVEATRIRVWIYDKNTGKQQAVWLLATRDPVSKGDVKYYLSNVAEEVSLDRLTYMAKQRYWIERAFEDGKSYAGMADYQIRGWHGWHRHMTMTMMVLLFMAKIKIEHAKDCPLISGNDVKEVLAYFLPKRKTTPEEIERQLNLRHQKRLRSIQQRYARQGLELPQQFVPN